MQRIFVIGLSVSLLLAVPSLGNPSWGPDNLSIANFTYNAANGEGGLYGGEFNFTIASGNWSKYIGSATSFKTFCAEGQTTGIGLIATIDDSVMFNQTGGQQIVSSGVKNVLARYFTGGFSAVGLTTGTLAEKNKALQAWLWQQMGPGMPNTAWATWASNNAAYIATINGYTGSHWGADRVLVLNTWGSVGQDGKVVGDRQSQFMFQVPAPGAALLAFLGLGIVGWVKRRMA